MQRHRLGRMARLGLRHWFKRTWHDPVGSKVIAEGIIGIGILLAVSSIAVWWTELLSWFGKAWTFLGAATLVPNWLIGAALLIIGVALLGGILIAIAIARQEVQSPTNPLREYKQDELLGIAWRWSYFQGTTVYNLVPFCPLCDFQIRPCYTNPHPVMDEITFSCEDCGKFQKSFPERYEAVEDLVKRLIHKKLRTGEWQKVLVPAVGVVSSTKG